MELRLTMVARNTHYQMTYKFTNKLGMTITRSGEAPSATSCRRSLSEFATKYVLSVSSRFLEEDQLRKRMAEVATSHLHISRIKSSNSFFRSASE